MTTIETFTKSLFIVLMTDFLISQDDLKNKYNYLIDNKINQLINKILNSIDIIHHKQILNIFYTVFKLRCSSDVFKYILEYNLILRSFEAIEFNKQITKLNVSNELSGILTDVLTDIKNLTILELKSDNLSDLNDATNIIKHNNVKSFEFYQRFGHGPMIYHDYNDFANKIGINESVEKLFLMDCGIVDIHLILLNFLNLKQLTIYDQLILNNNKPRHINFIADTVNLLNEIKPSIQFNNLIHLNISNMCDRIPYDILFDLTKRCKYLESFSARYCYTLNDDVMNNLFDNKNITKLCIANCKNISYDAFLKIPNKWPNLTTFDFCENTIINDEYLILIASKLNKLVKCDLAIWYHGILQKNFTIDCVACFIHFFGFDRARWVDDYIKEKMTEETYKNFLSKVILN